MPRYSSLRARLASFDHAYAIAVRFRCQTGCDQYIIRTDDPLQPVRIVQQRPPHTGCLLAEVI
ncbi:hypothetical protein BH10PSE12_BH10PSE12_07850 [soil metagenome]